MNLHTVLFAIPFVPLAALGGYLTLVVGGGFIHAALAFSALVFAVVMVVVAVVAHLVSRGGAASHGSVAFALGLACGLALQAPSYVAGDLITAWRIGRVQRSFEAMAVTLDDHLAAHGRYPATLREAGMAEPLSFLRTEYRSAADGQAYEFTVEDPRGIFAWHSYRSETRAWERVVD